MCDWEMRMLHYINVACADHGVRGVTMWYNMCIDPEGQHPGNNVKFDEIY